jgi:hypothetical protein
MKKDSESLKVADNLVKQSEDYSEEKLTRELESVATEILQSQAEEKIKPLTNPSAIALDSALPDAGEGLSRVKKTVKQLFVLYLTNQFVARAVNIRADTLISRGYKVVGGDEVGRKACNELIDNSGGINLFWQLSVNTDIAGDGFLEKIYNTKKNKILRLKHVHPLTLRFKVNQTSGKIIVNSEGRPVGYEQYYYDSDGIEQAKDVPYDIIAHLRFNTLGDEFTGISTLQPGYDTIVRLMNMEYSAAEAAVKTANPIIVGETNTKSPHMIALWGNILGRINGREQVFIPEGMKLSMLSPGPQNFNNYADYFLNAVVATFGVPKAMLLGESGGGNRAEGIVLQRHFYSVIRGNQQYIEDFFNEIFEEYAEISGFQAPQLEFEDVAEDADVNAQSAIGLYSAGIVTMNEARAMIGLYNLTEGNVINTNIQPQPATVSGSSTPTDLKKSDMATWHPESPGKPTGSQAGIKKKQKIDANSLVPAATK